MPKSMKNAAMKAVRKKPAMKKKSAMKKRLAVKKAATTALVKKVVAFKTKAFGDPIAKKNFHRWVLASDSGRKDGVTLENVMALIFRLSGIEAREYFLGFAVRSALRHRNSPQALALRQSP